MQICDVLAADCRRDFPSALSKLQVLVGNSDWLITLFVRVVIGRSNCFGLVFRQSFENRSIKTLTFLQHVNARSFHPRYPSSLG